jgi:hypothetical protein
MKGLINALRSRGQRRGPRKAAVPSLFPKGRRREPGHEWVTAGDYQGNRDWHAEEPFGSFHGDCW